MEAVINIQYQCGCGFKASSIRQVNEPIPTDKDPHAIALHNAIDHVEKTGHTLIVQGKISPSEPRPKEVRL